MVTREDNQLSFPFSEADVAGDPGEAVVRVSAPPGGGGVPGRRRVPTAKAHMVGRVKEEATP